MNQHCTTKDLHCWLTELRTLYCASLVMQFSRRLEIEDIYGKLYEFRNINTLNSYITLVHTKISWHEDKLFSEICIFFFNKQFSSTLSKGFIFPRVISTSWPLVSWNLATKSQLQFCFVCLDNKIKAIKKFVELGVNLLVYKS